MPSPMLKWGERRCTVNLSKKFKSHLAHIAILWATLAPNHICEIETLCHPLKQSSSWPYFHGEVGEVVNFGRLLGGVLCTWGVTMIGSPCRRHFKHTLAWGITLAQFDATPWMPRLEGDAYRSSFRSGRNAPRRHTPSGFPQRNVVSKLQTTICWGFSYEYSGESCCYLGDWMTFTASSRMNDDQWVVVCGGPSAVVHLDVIRWSRFDSIEWCQPNLLLNTPNLAYHTLT